MSMSINTNVVSINAQRNLGLSGSSLSVSMQRLSSGLRVNSAKDDAAGLAIAERMGAQGRGLKVAARNANDGISLAQTAEGALGKVGDMLQRARELAVQSSNATNSADDRKALQAEVSQLLAEVDRVAKTTSFNGRKILDGTFTGGMFQVGAGAGDNITVGALQNTKIAELGKVEYGASETAVNVEDLTGFAEAIDAGALKIKVGTGEWVGLDAIKEASSGQERMGQVVAAINAKTADTGVTAFLEGDAAAGYTVNLRSDGGDSVALRGFNIATTGIGAANTIGLTTSALKGYHTAATTLVSTTYTGNTAAELTTALVNTGTGGFIGTAPGALGDVSTNFSAATAAATWAEGLNKFKGVVAANTVSNGAATPVYSLDAAGAAKVKEALVELQASLDVAAVQQGEAARAEVYAALDAVLALDATGLTTAWGNGTATGALATLNTKLQAANNATANNVTGVSISNTATAEQLQAARNQIIDHVDALLSGNAGVSAGEATEKIGLQELSIDTQAGAWEAIKRLDSALDQVNAARGDLGALQTRFEKTVENIDIMSENISAARGRIIDADFASETANLSRAQILQQAGTAMVAQANQLPQQVLSLLR